MPDSACRSSEPLGDAHVFDPTLLDRVKARLGFDPSAWLGSLLRLHERIMDLRHKYVAHSEKNEIDSVDVTETDADIHLAMNYHTSFPYDRLYELGSLIKHVTDFIVDEQARQIGRASQAAGKPVMVGPRVADEGEDGGADRAGT